MLPISTTRTARVWFRLAPAPLLAALLLPMPSAANESLQVTLSAGQESNVPRGIDVDHELDAAFVGAQVFAGKFWQLGLNDSLLLGVVADSRQYGDLSGFRHVAAGLAATYSHKFGLGAYAPRMDLELRYRQQQGPGEARDFGQSSLALGLQKRLSPALQLRAGVETSEFRTDSLPEDPEVTAFGYDPDIALPYELFDYRADSLFLAADYTFANQLLLTATYTRSNGHTVASTAMPDLQTYKVSEAIYSDPALDNWFAYRLETNSHRLNAALSIPLGRDMALDLGADLINISAPAAKSYRNRLYTISMTWGF